MRQKVAAPAALSLEMLADAWRLTRRIEDRKGRSTGWLTGIARWRPDGDGLRQEETGVLRMETGPPLKAERVYLWRADPEGLAVFFADGRPFHRVIPGRLRDRHLCPPDIYDVRYEICDWPSWRQVWEVRGPSKDYRLISDFRPMGPAGAGR